MKYLNNFRYLFELEEVANIINFPIENWIIENKSLYNRLKTHKEEKYFIKMQNYSKKKEIIATEEEMLTWFDNLYFIYKVLEDLDDECLNIQIIQEYCIPFSFKRTDFLLIKDNKILILEFSNQNYSDNEYYETKFNQVINYKELISNLVTDNIKIGTYTFLYYPNDKDKNINDSKIENLKNFILYFFQNDIKNAFEQLQLINE